MLSLHADPEPLAALGYEALFLPAERFTLGVGQHALGFLFGGRANLLRVPARHRHHLVARSVSSWQ